MSSAVLSDKPLTQVSRDRNFVSKAQVEAYRAKKYAAHRRAIQAVERKMAEQRAEKK